MKVGILGGGQLARMIALAAYPLGIETLCFEPAENATAGHVTNLIKGNYDNHKLLDLFTQQCDVITIESENIPIKTLEYTQERCAKVRPGSLALYYSQDRLHEKSLCRALQIPTPLFFSVENQDELLTARKSLNYPIILKTRRFGYDGKGQWRFYSDQELSEFLLQFPKGSFIAEEFISFETEVSLVSVRNAKGKMLFYPLSENIHENGILRISKAPLLDTNLQTKAESFATLIAEKLDYVGVFALEFFVKGEELVFNEMAPRVHNSGHWTIEGAVTNQFENHVRAICDLPLGSCESRFPTTMFNCIGKMPSKNEILAFPDCHLHDYQKTPRKGRKVGHITLCGDNPPIKAIEELL